VALINSSVKRSTDASGDDIVTLRDPVTGAQLQGVALVDGGLAQLGVPANPLSVSDGWGANDLDEATVTMTYVGKERADGAWWILRLDTTSGLAIRYATITNNPTVATYTAAWAARAATLIYGTYGEAF
jgi:hypothetical protein